MQMPGPLFMAKKCHTPEWFQTLKCLVDYQPLEHLDALNRQERCHTLEGNVTCYREMK